MLKDKKIILTLIFIIIAISIISLFFVYSKKTNTIEYTKLKYRTNYTIHDANESYLTNYLSKKQNTLVIFFATWCPTCKEESSAINSFISNNVDIPVIVVSHDKNLDDLNNYFTENSYNWFAIFDSQKTIRENLDPGSSGIPCAYLLDPEGNILDYRKDEFTEEKLRDFYNQVSK